MRGFSHPCGLEAPPHGFRVFPVVPALKDAACGEGLPEELRKTVQHMRAEHKIYKRKLAADMVGRFLLLHHAAADSNHYGRAAARQSLERADIAEHAVFSMAAHRAGVEQNEIGLPCIACKGKAHLGKKALDLFAVRRILLASVGADKCQRDGAGPAVPHDFLDLGNIKSLRMLRGGHTLQTTLFQVETSSRKIRNPRTASSGRLFPVLYHTAGRAARKTGEAAFRLFPPEKRLRLSRGKWPQSRAAGLLSGSACCS